MATIVVPEALLLIYSMIPEETNFFYVKDVEALPKNLFSAIKKLSGKMINGDELTETEDKAWAYVNAAMTEKENASWYEGPNSNTFNEIRFLAKLVPFKQSHLNMHKFVHEMGSRLRVVHIGFYM